MLYLLNSPILTNYGTFEFSGPISIAQALSHIKKGFTSAIGHQATADVLTALLGQKISCARITINMQVGDKAIVFRLLQRLPEGIILSKDEISALPYELALLTKIGN